MFHFGIRGQRHMMRWTGSKVSKPRTSTPSVSRDNFMAVIQTVLIWPLVSLEVVISKVGQLNYRHVHAVVIAEAYMYDSHPPTPTPPTSCSCVTIDLYLFFTPTDNRAGHIRVNLCNEELSEKSTDLHVLHAYCRPWSLSCRYRMGFVTDSSVL